MLNDLDLTRYIGLYYDLGFKTSMFCPVSNIFGVRNQPNHSSRSLSVKVTHEIESTCLAHSSLSYLQDDLDRMAKMYPDRFKVYYVLNQVRGDYNIFIVLNRLLGLKNESNANPRLCMLGT